CCGGGCVEDPCSLVHCPGSTKCVVDSACKAGCEAGALPPKDQIVGAGGGGFACDVGGPSRAEGALWLGLLALFGLVLRLRRRGEEVRWCASLPSSPCSRPGWFCPAASRTRIASTAARTPSAPTTPRSPTAPTRCRISSASSSICAPRRPMTGRA